MLSNFHCNDYLSGSFFKGELGRKPKKKKKKKNCKVERDISVPRKIQVLTSLLAQLMNLYKQI